MTGWLRNPRESLTDSQQDLVGRVADLLDELDLAALDHESCTVSADDVGLHIVLVHKRLGPVVEVDDVGELLISYGSAEDRWAWEYAETRCLPTETGEAASAAEAFLRKLVTGHVELHILRRPWGVTTRSFWVEDDGSREQFLRGGTVRPYFRWQATPEVLRFDYRT